MLRWLADAAGFPESAGGTFVSGGSIANLSALVAARGGGEDAHRRRVIVAGASAHSSMAAAAHIMGCELVTAPAADAHGRLDGRVLEEALTGRDPARSSPWWRRRAPPTPAPSTTWPASRRSAPATACGCTWTAPTAAPRCSPRARARCSTASSGRTRSSSTRTRCSTRRSTAPPWSTATARRRAARSRRRRTTSTPSATSSEATHPTSPSTSRGGCAACRSGRRSWPTAPTPTPPPSTTAWRSRRTPRRGSPGRPALELVIEPAFTVLLVRRPGWSPDDYAAWCADALARGVAMLMPTRHAGETVLRFCFVNPLTTREDVDLVLSDLAAAGALTRRLPAHHRLDLEEVLEPEPAPLAAVAGLLVAAEGRAAVGRRAVEVHHAGAHAAGHAPRPLQVGRLHVAGEAEVRGVGQLDRVLLVAERRDAEHGTEDLLAEDAHVGRRRRRRPWAARRSPCRGRPGARGRRRPAGRPRRCRSRCSRAPCRTACARRPGP